MSIRTAAAAASLLLQIYVARIFGIAETGAFFLQLALASVLGAVGGLGLGLATTRHVAMAMASGEGTARSYVSRALLMSVVVSLVIAIAVVLGVWLFGPLFHGAVDYRGAFCIGLFVIGFPALEILVGALRGAGQNAAPQIVTFLLTPTLALVVLLLSSATGWAVDPMMVYTGATLLALSAALSLYSRLAVPDHVGNLRPKWGTILRDCRGFYYTNLVSMLTLSAVTLLLGVLGTPSDVGIYRAAERVAAFIQMVAQAVSYTVAPRYSASFAIRDRRGLIKTVRKASATVFVFTAPFLLCILLFPVDILKVFGHEFEPRYSVLLLLAAGQIPGALAGGVNQLLGMTGHAGSVGHATLASLVLSVLLGIALIPTYGATGAAMSTSIGAAVNIILLNLQAIRYLRIDAAIYMNLLAGKGYAFERDAS